MLVTKIGRNMATRLEGALRGLLQDIAEVLERQGEEWWDETVTSGLHHRQVAEELLGEPGEEVAP